MGSEIEIFDACFKSSMSMLLPQSVQHFEWKGLRVFESSRVILATTLGLDMEVFRGQGRGTYNAFDD